LNVIIILIVVVVGLIGVVFGVVMYKKKGAATEDATRQAGFTNPL
jgi:flagellar basal body-associated protein FliL